ncbi:hypothetical protein H7F33_14035 [Pedobacter sp. PAMC26386]|nr:hypothetical protein H7F33_14035 [Pedobacter sp. PAMC26386]
MTDPKDVLQILHLIHAGLASGLLSKEEVIEWADKIITKEDHPDIFFIDLALSSSKSSSEILHYFNEYLNFENAVIQGRPLLAMLYKRFSSRQFTLEETVVKLFRLKFEAIFTKREESYIYSIDNDFDCAKDNVYGTLEAVNADVDKFLSFYKDYSLDSFEQWQNLDLKVESKLDEEIDFKQEQESVLEMKSENVNKPWWKFW